MIVSAARSSTETREAGGIAVRVYDNGHRSSLFGGGMRDQLNTGFKRGEGV
jgi:hypothetical protein